MDITLTGDAIKAIADECGSSGVAHLLDSIRLMAEADYAKATGQPRAAKPKLDSAISWQYAEQYNKSIGKSRGKNLCMYRLAITAKYLHTQGLDANLHEQLAKERAMLEKHKPKEIAECASWLAEHSFECMEELGVLRTQLFAEYCNTDFSLDWYSSEEQVRTARRQLAKKELTQHPFSKGSKLTQKDCPKLSKLWAEHSGESATNFGLWLEARRPKSSLEHVGLEQFCKLLGVPWQKLREDNDADTELYLAYSWVNNGLVHAYNDSQGRCLFLLGLL